MTGSVAVTVWKVVTVDVKPVGWLCSAAEDEEGAGEDTMPADEGAAAGEEDGGSADSNAGFEAPGPKATTGGPEGAGAVGILGGAEGAWLLGAGPDPGAAASIAGVGLSAVRDL